MTVKLQRIVDKSISFLTENVSATNFNYWVIVSAKNKKESQNIWCFQLLKYENLLLFLVLYHVKIKILGVWQNNMSDDVTLDHRKVCSWFLKNNCQINKYWILSQTKLYTILPHCMLRKWKKEDVNVNILTHTWCHSAGSTILFSINSFQQM